MSKIAMYLQEHISGDVSANPAILKAMSTDMSVLTIQPEMVVYPKLTSDIRKVARFAWQLAEKGHPLALTPRGNGTDETGAAIGPGVIVALPAHMNRIFELDTKQKLVRLQPGVGAKALNDALALQGAGIPSLPASAAYSTIGGAVANNAAGPLAGKYGDMSQWVNQLEVVLANGDLIQTQRLSRRELNKRKGMQTFEGEIYRNLDNLIEDKKQLIESDLSPDAGDNVGYSTLAKVKQKDGSFDLTPLFVGSQGTLGIISEMIMKCDFVSAHMAVATIAFASNEEARDVLDHLEELEPAFLEYYDGEFFAQAAAQGKKYSFCTDLAGKVRTAVVVGFDDFNERARLRKLKKVHKLVKNTGACIESADGDEAAALLAVREVTAVSVVPAGSDTSAPPLVDGAYVPRERSEDFRNAVAALGQKYSVSLPVHSRVLDNLFYTRPTLQLKKVGDKQKIFKLLDEYSTLVEQFGGHMIGTDGEGRVKARFAYKALDPGVVELFAAVKDIFDPHGILNPGVKQTAEVRQLVSQLRSGYDTTPIANYVPYI